MLLYAYAGITMQSLSRPGRLSEVRRANVSMYPNKQMHEVANFGPIRILGVSFCHGSQGSSGCEAGQSWDEWGSSG